MGPGRGLAAGEAPAAPVRASRRPARRPGEDAIAVVVAGAAASGPADVLAALLGRTEPLLPTAGYLRVTYGPHAVTVPGAPSRPGRPVPAPRRVDVTLPDPMLRHFALVGAPPVDAFGFAATRLLADVAARAGAVVYTVTARHDLTGIEYQVLREVADAGAAVFFALTPDDSGEWWPTGDTSDGPLGAGTADLVGDPVGHLVALRRERVAAEVPALSEAPWLAVDPVAVDVAYLRRALLDWASDEALRRAGAEPLPWPVPPGELVVVRGVEGGWAARLGRRTCAGAQHLRDQLVLGLAQIHLRATRGLASGSVPAGALAAVLDDELQALSVHAAAEEDRIVQEILDEVLTTLLGAAPSEVVQRCFARAVRDALPTEYANGPSARALILGADGAISAVGSVDDALWAYPSPVGSPVLPPYAVALAADCFARPADASGLFGAATEPDALRRGLRAALQAVELELGSELSRRFDALRRAVTALGDVAAGTPLLPPR